jgi:hypothetical protein
MIFRVLHMRNSGTGRCALESDRDVQLSGSNQGTEYGHVLRRGTLRCLVFKWNKMACGVTPRLASRKRLRCTVSKDRIGPMELGWNDVSYAHYSPRRSKIVCFSSTSNVVCIVT